MNLARQRRSLTVWTLYASVLFSLFVCGIHHGQMSGLSLSGLGGGFCSIGSDSGAGIDLSGSQGDQAQLSMLSCPLCSSFGQAVALNSSAWVLKFLPGSAVAPVILLSRAQPPPRDSWPSINPRASPTPST